MLRMGMCLVQDRDMHHPTAASPPAELSPLVVPPAAGRQVGEREEGKGGGGQGGGRRQRKPGPFDDFSKVVCTGDVLECAAAGYLVRLELTRAQLPVPCKPAHTRSSACL